MKAQNTGTVSGSQKVRVMVVDDSAVIRGLLTRMLEEEKQLSVVASVGDGLMAVKALKREPVDVIVLDIEMPNMDGLEALPKLLEIQPNVRVIMASTLTTRNAEVTLRALQMGAADAIAKPTSKADIHAAGGFRTDFVAKVRALGEAVTKTTAKSAFCNTSTPRKQFSAERKLKPVNPASNFAPKPKVKDGITLRSSGRVLPEILAIGSSTGGPQALFAFVKALGADWKLPILITQHMPPTFTKILASHLAASSGRPCIETKGGEPITAGHVYVAPGDYHMLVANQDGQKIIKLSQTAPENFCRPAVDPMLRSIASVYGAKVVTVILTGMGHDGADGCSEIVNAGGTVIGQDEETSVVWGMPGAVASRGLCSAVLPIDEIAPYVRNFVMRKVA